MDEPGAAGPAPGAGVADIGGLERLAIVGPGRVGGAIAQALRAAGRPVSGPYGRGYRGVGLGGQHDRVVLLCVPDAAIADAAALIDRRALVGHCSGASGLDVLGDREGFSVHPLMTVTEQGTDLTGVWAAVAGSTPAALRVATALASAVGLRPVEVSEPDRVAYHAAAAIASNFLVTLEDAAAQLMSSAGLDRAVLLPLASAALQNWGRAGAAALTGPVARGDTGTVERHRAVIAERAPELSPLFEAMVSATERMAARDRNGTTGQQPDR